MQRDEGATYLVCFDLGERRGQALWELEGHAPNAKHNWSLGVVTIDESGAVRHRDLGGACDQV